MFIYKKEKNKVLSYRFNFGENFGESVGESVGENYKLTTIK